MKLLLVDGTNIVMRAAFGGDIEPREAVITATAMIERAAREFHATHLIVALDCPDVPSWRKEIYSGYKADRKRDTSLWIVAAGSHWAGLGWRVEFAPRFEADDVIATIALRSSRPNDIVVFSSDSDLLPLTVPGCTVIRPLGQGAYQSFDAAGVMERYKIPGAHLLYDFKAMAGESGDNIPGVPGIGLKRAADLLHRFGDLNSIIDVGKGGIEKYSAIVAKHEAAARLALQLVSLNPDAPVPLITPSTCALHLARSAA